VLHIPLHSFDLEKWPCSFKLVTALTAIAPGGKADILRDKINGRLSCLTALHHLQSQMPLRSFRTDGFPQATGQSGEVSD